MEDLIKRRIEQANDIGILDQKINGRLVTICYILGHPIMTRFAPYADEEMIKHEVSELMMLIKEVSFPEEMEVAEPRKISLKTASEISGKSIQTLRRYIKKGILKATKFGKEYRVNESNF